MLRCQGCGVILAARGTACVRRRLRNASSKVGLVTNRHDESQIRGVQGCLIVHIHMGDIGL